MSAPYCSQPALWDTFLVFVSAGDLWRLELGQRVARRLSDGRGTCSRPIVSPDGRSLAFAAEEEGPPAVHVMPAEGGPARRLVHHATFSKPVAFTADGSHVIFASTL